MSQLVEMEWYIASAKDETMSKFSSDVNKSRSHLRLLFEEGHRVALPLLHSIGSCGNWARRTPPMIEEAEKPGACAWQNGRRVQTVAQEFREWHWGPQRSSPGFQSKGDIRHLSSFLDQLEMLWKDMSTLFNKAHAFQNEERLLGWPVFEFAELVRI